MQQREFSSELDRRVAERTRELAEANEELQLQAGLLQHLPVSAWTLKPDGTPDFVNRVWLEFSGQTLDFVRSCPEAWMTAIHPEDREAAAKAFWEGVRSGQDFAFETRSLRAQDGTYRWHFQQAVVVRDAEGKVLKFVGTTTDIDDRKRAEDALRASESNLIQIINTIPMLAWSTLPNGYVDFLNKRWLDFTGLSAEQAGGFGWSVSVHPDDAHELLKYWQTALTTGVGIDVEARLRRFDGQYRWFLFRADPLHDESGAIVKWYGTNTDIDDRKRAEEALRTSERNLRQLTETIPEMLWSATPEGSIDYFSGRLLEYSGLQAADVMGDNWTRLIHPDDAEQAVRAWTTSVTGAVPYRVEVRTFHVADHTFRWCEMKALPLLDQAGNVLKWHGTVVDMHDWKEAQEELRITQAELARVMRVMTIGQLTASVAHEVSQPLSGVITNASTCLRMLKSDPPNIDGARETMQRLIRDGNRASEVISRLRALFSKKQIEVEPLNLNEAIREVGALLSGELQRNNVILKLELSDHVPIVHCDRVQLQQVILNLLRNASDAMITLNDRQRQVFVRTEADETHVNVSVQDSGVGFSPEISARLFEPFFTTKQEGMGIGLSVSRSIVEAHHGRLWAVHNSGPGATFAFSIPHDIRNLSDPTE